MSEGGDSGATFLARGVDSLYLYLDCGAAVDWAAICEEAQKCDYGQGFLVNGLPFVRVRAWIRSYPICLQHTQFMFFLNSRTAYVKVLSLAFELRSFDGVVMQLCRVLDRMRSRPSSVPWLELLRVSRIDVFCDFAYDGDFELDQFRTKLRRCGFFQSGDNFESVTIYFGSRELLLVRLYVKSEEIKHSGKIYLRSSWRERGCEGKRIWRLEFEFHKAKIEEICPRELIAFDAGTIEQLFSYGVHTFEYVTEAANHRNLFRKPLHPVWQELQDVFSAEYSLRPKRVRKLSVEYRYKRARPWILAWFAARGVAFEDLPKTYVDDFRISRSDYELAILQYEVGSDSVVDFLKGDQVEDWQELEEEFMEDES